MTSPSNELNGDRLLIEVPLREGYKSLGPVVLYRRLGKGGMGTVYLGRHLRLGIDVAVKCLSHDLADDERYVQRFRSEASAAARLHHPNIVRVFDVDEDSRLHFLIMEYVDGESVGDRVRRKGPLEEREALTILLGAAQGLAHAHARGFVHRDIKPDNILVSRMGEVKVADLGLAKPLDQVGRSMSAGSAVLGTPAFMAPEQARSSPDVGLPADVHALGATLYWMLTGRHGFGGKDVLELLSKLLADPFPDVRALRTGVSAETASLIERCTRKDPAQRPADAAELARSISSILGAEPTQLADADSGKLGETVPLVSPPPEQVLSRIQISIGHGPRTATTPPRRRMWAAGGALLALLGIAGAGWLGFSERPSTDPGPQQPSQVEGVDAEPRPPTDTASTTTQPPRTPSALDAAQQEAMQAQEDWQAFVRGMPSLAATAADLEAQARAHLSAAQGSSTSAPQAALAELDAARRIWSQLVTDGQEQVHAARRELRAATVRAERRSVAYRDALQAARALEGTLDRAGRGAELEAYRRLVAPALRRAFEQEPAFIAAADDLAVARDFLVAPGEEDPIALLGAVGTAEERLGNAADQLERVPRLLAELAALAAARAAAVAALEDVGDWSALGGSRARLLASLDRVEQDPSPALSVGDFKDAQAKASAQAQAYAALADAVQRVEPAFQASADWRAARRELLAAGIDAVATPAELQDPLPSAWELADRGDFAAFAQALAQIGAAQERRAEAARTLVALDQELTGEFERWEVAQRAVSPSARGQLEAHVPAVEAVRAGRARARADIAAAELDPALAAPGLLREALEALRGVLSALDTQAPSLVRASPADGSFLLDASPEIVLTFDEPLATATLEGLSMALSADGMTARIRPRFEQERSSLTWTATDLVGNRASGTLALSFSATGLPGTIHADPDIDFMTLPEEELSRYLVLMQTRQGEMLIEMWPDVAPNHVRNFLDLSHSGFYDGLIFHRVIPGFMVQGGDPTGIGTGSGPRTLKAEFSDRKHVRGVVSAARMQRDPNSATCQFFIVHATSEHLDGQYSVFGKVIDGIETVDRIAAQPRVRNSDTPAEPQGIISAIVVRR